MGTAQRQKTLPRCLQGACQGTPKCLGGVYRLLTFPVPGCAPVQAGALMAPFWELSLLTHHYHPHVAAACTKLAAGASSALLPMAASNAGVFAVGYTVSAGTFKPTPQTQ